MYSPKIIPELIPKLYRKAKERGIPMTRLVNEILSDKLKDEPEAVNEDYEHVAEGVAHLSFANQSNAV
ncbi:MAG: hypothetical protein LWX70_14960 [Sphingobacteriia bacterium]|nr:hypothetical protein [Sphingobacteriia bacterium]